MPAITRRSGQQAGSTPHDSAKPPAKLTPHKPEPSSQESSAGQSELPAPASERRLHAQPKTRTKDKHVYGERGGLRGIMKMPLEVFTEIARHLCPGDLITLIRSTKLFRSIFLRRSAANVWECARKNVPRLPPCPFAMCEPQYAALLFSKHCTLCGGFAKAKPDPYLFVRLCPTCRESKLIDRADVTSHHKLGLDNSLFVSSNVIKPKNKANVKFIHSTGEYCLIDEVDEALRVQHQFIHAGDERGLLKYVSEQRDKRNARLEDASRLNLYLQLAGDISGVQLHTANHQRRREIYERLTAMGWNEEDMLFEGGLESTWDSLVSGSRSLTNDGWSRLLSDLISILNLNRTDRAQRIKRKQTQARNQRLSDLLTHLRRTTHPFGQIIEAVGIDLSHPLETFPDPFQGSCVVLQNPFPRSNEMFNWECVNDMWAGDLDRAEVDQLFNERRTQIADAVNEWRIRTERHLTEEYQQGDQGGEVKVVLTVSLIFLEALKLLSHVSLH
ncbi:hypothetical protein FRC09_013762 [Ceratobasidium sp. 395]|nr:hypothetical protein FRC09_013762 [Ceratobasidium sp. 395]